MARRVRKRSSDDEEPQKGEEETPTRRRRRRPSAQVEEPEEDEEETEEEEIKDTPRRSRRRQSAAAEEAPEKEDPRQQSNAPSKADMLLKSGTKLTMRTGEETFSPIQYNSFKLDSITIEMTLDEPCTLGAACMELRACLEVQRQALFEQQLDSFLDRLAQASQRVKERAA